MKFSILHIIFVILMLATQSKLDAVITHAEAFVSDPAICIIGDEQVPFFVPESDGTLTNEAAQEERNKKSIINLIYDLAIQGKPVDIIIEGNPFCAQTLVLKKKQQERINPNIKTGLFGSLVIFAQKNNLTLGDNLRFVYSNNIGPATSSIASFIWMLRLEGKAHLEHFIEKEMYETYLSVPEAKELLKQIPDGSVQPSDFDMILSAGRLKQLFFARGESFDRSIQGFKEMINNRTVKQLFDELHSVKLSMEKLNKQLAASNFSERDVIEGAAQTIGKLIKALRIGFFEKYTGRHYDKIKSLPLVDVLVDMIKQHSFAEIDNFLHEWFSYFSMHACTMLAFQTVLQSFDKHRKVLFIGSPSLANIIYNLMRPAVESRKDAVKEEIVTPPFENQFDQDQTKKVIHDIRNILLDLRCHTCGNQLNLQRCRGCKQVRYCSRECQTMDWPQHKLICHE